MLRITQIRSRKSTTLKLEGKLLCAWSDELRSAVKAAVARQLPLHLDLANLSFADDAGINLLCEIINRGARVAACCDFIIELLNQERGYGNANEMRTDSVGSSRPARNRR
jgi:ABC-type transporter Mla MlaB component